ncbi:MAG: histidine kinase, partial [Anaerolineae bacterium]
GGDLDHPITVQGQDEIRQLAAAFERMRQDLSVERRRVQELAILEERDRLAREMHDGFAQALSVLNLNARAARRAMVKGDADQAAQALDTLDQIIDQAYADVREEISGLRTLVPHREGLIATAGQYLEEFGLQYGIDTALSAEGTEDIAFTTTQEIQLLRILQEALSNVRKHAQADHVQVRFQRANPFGAEAPSGLPSSEAKGREADDVQITVADDGVGFDRVAVERSPKRTFGLAIMRERAESLGGSFGLDTRPGAGTTVIVQIPLAQEGGERRGADARLAGG